MSREHGLVTPPELIRHLYHSPHLSWLFALVMIIFTIPYLALQPMAAGYALEALIGLPYGYGCLIVTAIIVLYTLRGGLRAVAWTDLFQGMLMFSLLLAALVIIADHHGGFLGLGNSQANTDGTTYLAILFCDALSIADVFYDMAYTFKNRLIYLNCRLQFEKCLILYGNLVQLLH